MNTPLVSVIIPSYNHAEYVEQSILSVVNQSYKNIELIVIEDGSTDHSRNILEVLQKQFGFYLEFQSNQGISKTMNKAIRYAKGKYITGVASDDIWVEGRLEKQVRFMESHPDCSVAVGKALFIDKDGQERDDIVVFSSITHPEQQLKFESLIEDNCIPAGATMFTKEIWEKCGGYNEDTPIEDWDFWLKIAYENKIAYLDEYLVYYRRHDSNISNNTLKMYVEAWKIVDSWKDKMSPDLRKKVLSRRNSLTFCVLARSYKKEATRYLYFPSEYFDGFMLKNYLKGFYKLFFC